MKRILIVEDNFELADNLEEFLVLRGMDVVIASSAEAAIELATKDEPFDVILTDMRLPGIDGVTLISRLRERGTSAPVVLMSAYITSDAVYTAEHAGALAVLFKPLDLSHLTALLDACTSEERVVLVLDDNKAQADNLKDALEARDYKVVVAGSLNEALGRRVLPRVAIVDFMLPDGNGLDAALRLKARDPKLPVLLVSGYPSDAQAWLDRSHGAAILTERFEKPAPLADVLRAVDKALSEREKSSAPLSVAE